MADARHAAASVLVLAAIAGAGSFAHIRDTAAERPARADGLGHRRVHRSHLCHGRPRTAARPAHRPHHQTAYLANACPDRRRPVSLAANLDQAQPTTWGRITAATPAAAFLVAVSMLERRTTYQQRPDEAPVVVLPAPARDDQLVPAGPAGDSPARTATTLLDFAPGSPPSTTPRTVSPSPATRSAPGSAYPTSSPPTCSARSAPPPTPPEGDHP